MTRSIVVSLWLATMAAAGAHTSHTLDLAPGAQNDVYVTPRDSLPAGTTYMIYVTSADCTTFSPGAPKWEPRYPVIPQDPCAIVSSDSLRSQTLVVRRAKFGAGAHVTAFQHEMSGANQFKLWIIGDPRVAISYDVKVTWTRGHDC